MLVSKIFDVILCVPKNNKADMWYQLGAKLCIHNQRSIEKLIFILLLFWPAKRRRGDVYLCLVPESEQSCPAKLTHIYAPEII
jgi:hypothetical protein